MINGLTKKYRIGLRYLFYITTLLIAFNIQAFSAVFTTTQAGDFNNLNTWVGGSVPSPTDDVIINHNVYLGFNTTINDVTINSGGILRSNAISVSLTMTGDLDVQAGGEFRAVHLVVNFLNLICNGTTNFTNAGTAAFNNVTINSGKSLVLNSAIGGGLLSTAVITVNGTLNFNNITVSIPLLGSINFNSGSTLRTNVAGGVSATILGTGTKNYHNNTNYYFDANVTDTGFGSITNVKDMTFDGCIILTTTSLTISGILYNGVSNGIVNDGNTSNTFTLTGNHVGDVLRTQIGNLKVTGNYTNYGRLRVAGILEVDPGITLGINTSVDFLLGSGAKIINNGTITSGNFRALGNATIEGTGNTQIQTLGNDGSTVTQTSGTFTVAGTTTLQAGNSFSFNNLNVSGNFTFDEDIDVEGDLSVTGTLSSSASELDLQNGGNTITGGGTIDLDDFIINGATTLSGTDIIINDITLNAGTFDIEDNYLRIDNNITNNGGNIDATDNNSEVRFTGNAVDITIPANSFVSNAFGNLTFNKNAKITASNNYTVNNVFSMFNAGLTFDLLNYNFTINGTVTYSNGDFDATDDASTITIGGTGALTFFPLLSNECGNLTLTRNGTITLGNNLTVDGTMTLNNASLIFDVQANTLTLNNPIVSTNGAIDLTDNNSTIDFAFSGSTVFSNGAFLSGQVGNMTISGSNTITLGSNADIDGAFTMNNASALFDIDAYRFRLGGNINYTAGTIDGTDASSTLSFAGSSPITYNAGAFVNFGTIGNLELLQSNTITQVGEVNVLSSLIVNNANLYFDVQANTFSLFGELDYTAGFIDFTDVNSTFRISGANPFILDGDNLVNNQLGNFRVERNDLVTLSSDLEVLNILYLHNPNMDFDIQSNNIRLSLKNNIDNQSPASTKIRCESAGTVEFTGSNPITLDGADFNNNRIYNLDLDNSTTTTLSDFLYIKNNLRMSASTPILDIVDNDLIIEGNITYVAGSIDATDNSGQITIDGTGAFTMPTYFVNNEIGILQIQRVGTVTQSGAINVDNSFNLNNVSSIYNLNSNTLTISNNFVSTNGQIDAQANGSAFKVANSAATSVYSANSFVNNTINEAYFERGVTLNNDYIFEDLLKIENGTAAFGNTNIEIQGDVTLDNNGAISTGGTNSLTFSNTTNLTNNSTGNIGLNDIFVTGTLNSTANPTIAGNFDVSGVSNFSSGTVTFQNAIAKTITNTGTLDFNYVNIGSGARINTTSSFDLNNDFRMVDNTSVFVASSPSDIAFRKNNLNVYAATDSDGSSTGIVLYSITIGNSLYLNFKGAYDYFINGNYTVGNSRLYMDDNSNLFFTYGSGSSAFNNMYVYDLTFTSSATFGMDTRIHLRNTLTVEAGGILNAGSILSISNNSATIYNNSPNTADNLSFYFLNMSSGTLTTNDSFALGGDANIDINSVINQTSGTFRKHSDAINNSGSVNLNDLEIIGNVTTSSGFTIDGDYFLQNAAYSFTASAGSITFTKSNFNIENAGTTQFYDFILDNSITNGTTDDSFTIAGDLTLGASSFFTASSPSEITFSGNGVLTLPGDAFSTTGLFLHDVDFTGNYTTNSPASNQTIFDVSGSLAINGSLNCNTNTNINFSGAGTESITNNGTLDFNRATILSGDYTTSTDFNVKTMLDVNLGSTFEASAGTVYLTGTSSSITSSVADLNDFTFNNLEASSTDAYASGSFTIAGDITVQNSSSFTHSLGEIRFVDGGTHTIANSAQLIFNDFSIEDNNIVQTNTDFTVKSDQFDLLGTSSSFTALGGEVTFKVNSSSATITSGGGLGSVVFHDLLIDDAKSLYIEENLDIIIEGDFTSGLSSNLYTYGNTNFYFQGGTQQTISVDNSSNINFQYLTLNNSTGIKLSDDINVDELNVHKNLTLTDGDLDLFGANILTLQEPDAYLYETGGIVTNTIDDDTQLGHIYYDYTFNSTLNTINFAGLGIGFRQGTASNVFGQTILKRFHTTLLVSGGSSIQRLYSIETANDGLKARPIISYYDSELNGQAEDSLILSSTRTKDDLWAAINTNNLYKVNRLESADTIDQFIDFNKLWTAVVPLRVSLDELGELVNQDDYPNGRLIAGTSDHTILSFQITATDYTDITDLKIYLNNNNNQFENFKLYKSSDDFFNTTNDNELIATISSAVDSLEINNLANITVGPLQAINFFLTADISDSVTIFADSVLVFINQSGITISQGIINLKTVGDTYYKFQQRIDAIFNPIGLDDTPLIPNSYDNVIYGFKLQPLGNQASLKAFDLHFENSPFNAISGNMKLIRSIDNSYNTGADNTEIDLTTDLIISANNTYTFEIDDEEIFDENGRYYFVKVDSVSANANDGTLEMKIGIPQQSLTSTRAAPVAVDTVFGIDYSFTDLDAYITSTSYISNGTIYKNGRKQNLFGFVLETENNANLSKIILEYTTTGNLLLVNHFSSVHLWQDLNNNKVADPDELIVSGNIDSKYIVFENFATTVNFSGSKNFIVTAEVRNSAPINSTIQMIIPNESYIIFDTPVKLEAGGPFYGSVRTVKNANIPTSMIVSHIFPDFIQSGDDIDVTIKLLDSDGNETISDNRYDFTINAIGDVTKSGNTANSINKGESYITIQNYRLTNDAGASPVYIIASCNSFANANSATFTIFPPGPVAHSSDLLLSAGDPAISSISVNSWTNGSGDGRIIVARLGRSPEAPTNRTIYSAENNANLSQINSNQTAPGSYVIYNGSDISTQFKFKGLASGQNYYFKIFDYKIFNNEPVYINSNDNPTYVYKTQFSSDPYTTNVDSDNAVTIYEDDVINGALYSDEEEDWYKFTKTGKNLLVNSCGEFLYIDLYKYDATAGRIKLLRRTQNTGTNCQIIILNDENADEEYFLKIHRLHGVLETQYQFRVRSYNFELLSRQSCDCP